MHDNNIIKRYIIIITTKYYVCNSNNSAVYLEGNLINDVMLWPV